MLPKATEGSHTSPRTDHDHGSFNFGWQVKIGCANKHKQSVNIKCLVKINRAEYNLPAKEALDFIAFAHPRQVTGANAVVHGTFATCPFDG